MKQLKLFDVPKDSPSRHELLREFCKLHGIETHYCQGIYDPWMACHMTVARSLGEDYGKHVGDIGDAVAYFCRLLEERGALVTGPSERDVVTELCNNCDLPLPP